jgi:hypothetical protein
MSRDKYSSKTKKILSCLKVKDFFGRFKAYFNYFLSKLYLVVAKDYAL